MGWVWVGLKSSPIWLRNEPLFPMRALHENSIDPISFFYECCGPAHLEDREISIRIYLYYNTNFDCSHNHDTTRCRNFQRPQYSNTFRSCRIIRHERSSLRSTQLHSAIRLSLHPALSFIYIKEFPVLRTWVFCITG